MIEGSRPRLVVRLNPAKRDQAVNSQSRRVVSSLPGPRGLGLVVPAAPERGDRTQVVGGRKIAAAAELLAEDQSGTAGHEQQPHAARQRVRQHADFTAEEEQVHGQQHGGDDNQDQRPPGGEDGAEVPVACPIQGQAETERDEKIPRLTVKTYRILARQ